jgi:hypothetical protein
VPRVNFREVRDRFTHIDATFEGCNLGFDGTAEYRVRFYPWWEHPRYLAARDAGAPWGFSGQSEEGARTVTVHAIEPIAFDVTRLDQVLDWAFVETGPCIWRHEPSWRIFVNQPVDPEVVCAAVARQLDVHRSWLADLYLDLSRLGSRPSFALENPASVSFGLVQVLRALGIDHFPQRTEPPAPHGMVALVVDDACAIVARDFELDVPEFEHRDDWFTP